VLWKIENVVGDMRPMLDEVDVMNFKIQKGKSVVGLYACNAKSET